MEASLSIWRRSCSLEGKKAGSAEEHDVEPIGMPMSSLLPLGLLHYEDGKTMIKV